MTRPPQQGIQRGSVLGASALVLESDDSARGFVCHALKYMGLVVHGVAGVDEALEWMARSERPLDLMLIDQVPCGTRSTTLFAQLLLKHPRAAVIHLLGSPRPLGDDFDPNSGSSVFLSKPFGFRLLAAAVTKALVQRKGG